jgi:septation ring formation regulator EzrA
MKLNKTQRDYAISRLNDKIREKSSAEMPEYIPSKKDDMSAIYRLLESCNVPMIPEDQFKSLWNIRVLNEVLIFPVYFDKEYEENEKKCRDIRVKYEDMQQQILDKIYLCDEAEEALALINSI